MTPSVSSSRRRSSHFGQLLGGAVLGRVVGDLVDPAAPDHPDPRPRQDPDRVRVVAAAGAGVGVDLGRPRRGVPGVVRERGDRLAEALVARPAEVDGVVLAGLLGDRHGAGEGGDRVGAVVAWAAVAPLGEHLGGVGPTRPWQRREDLGVRVLTQVGGHATVEVLDRGVEGAQDPDHGHDGVAAGLGFGAAAQAGRGLAQAGHQLGGRPAAAVAVLGAERAHAGLAQVGRRRWGRVALQERQRDLAFDVGKDRQGAGPERVQAGGELVGGGHALVDQVGAGPDHGAQRPGLRRERLQDAQPVVAQPQVLGDHLGVGGVGLGARQHLGVAPCLDRVGADRHDGVAGLQQPIDQPPVGPLDGHGQLGWVAEPAKAGGELAEPVGGVGDLERGHALAGLVQHAHRVLLRGSDTSVGRTSAGRSLTGALGRVPLLPVIGPRGAGGGSVMQALNRRPPQAVTRLPPSPSNEDHASPRQPEGGPVTAHTELDAREALAERLIDDVTGALETLGVYLGLELGLYQALADLGAATQAEIAATAGIAPRYAREWLEQQAVAGYLACDDPAHPAEERRYRLPAGHAEVLLDADSPYHAAPVAGMLASVARVLPQLLQAYRTGGGVPYAAYGQQMRRGIAAVNRPMFLHELASSWLPAVPDIDRRLRTAPPSRVLDLGCGLGASSIALARAYPRARVVGVDLDAASVTEARAEAAEAGVADRVTFVVGDAAHVASETSFDLITVFEALHDMADPVGTLRAARALLAGDGSILVADERVADAFTAPGDPVERFMYGWSILHCLPATLAERPAEAAGTVLRAPTVARWATAAGFAGFEVLPIDNLFWRFYRMRG